MKVAVTTLAFCVAALLALGMVMLYSSSMTQGTQYLQMQLVWCTLGFICCVGVTSLDYQVLRKNAWLLFGAAVLLLVLVLVPHLPGPFHALKIQTVSSHGARRWFDIHGVRFQPSELGKIALIIALAWYGDRFQRRMHTLTWGILLPVGIIAVILGLVFREPDRGTTILLAAVSGSMLLLAGVRWRFIVPPVILAAVGLTYSILHDPMRMKRIFSWLDLEQNKEGVGYQAYQAMLALGSGGWNGLGLGNGLQKHGFVPENHTDFIFSVIGEELGLVATLLIIVAFIILIFCGMHIAMRARDTFGMLLAAGITLLIGCQAFINIGVVTSALPNKGLPLPFISYGGSNLLAMLTCVGILFSVARQAPVREKLPVSDASVSDNPFAAKAA
jgi:cell division protein FtsW